MKSFAYLAILLLLSAANAYAIDCPKAPEQLNKDWEVEVNAAVAKIGPVKGAELRTRTKNATNDLLGKLPDAGKIYLEQMMYSAYCSSLRDDTSLTPREKTQRINTYNKELRKSLDEASNKKKAPISKSKEGGKPSISDRLTIDENPTRVVISEVAVRNWIGDSEPFVTLYFKNDSHRTATALLASLRAKQKTISFTVSKTSSIFQRKDIALKAGESIEWPIAPLSEFLNIFSENCSGCFFLGVGMEPDMSLELTSQLCKEVVTPEQNCSIHAKSLPFLVEYSFRSIFDEQVTISKSLYIYLSPSFRTALKVP